MQRLAAVFILAAIAPVRAEAPAPRRGEYLIACAPDLQEAAEAWGAYRRARGWTVTIAIVAPGEPGARREAVRAAIDRRARAGGGRVTVLLLGDAGGRGIPTWYIPQDDPTLGGAGADEYATDHPYQVRSAGDDEPAYALGRVPARTGDEAMAVLDKTRRYEEARDLGPWRRRVVYAAGEGRFGLADALLERLFERMVRELVPDGYDVTLSYAKPTSIYCPPPSRLTETLLSGLGDGALMFNYVGHGTATSFDDLHWNGRRVATLESADLQRLPGGHARLPIALLTCCSAGWYDLPEGALSLGEAMLLNPAGPVAVIAASRPSHPYANLVLQKEVTTLLLRDGVETAGDLDLAACRRTLEVDERDLEIDALARPIAAAMRWPTPPQDLRRMHVRLYNLLGDPALVIARARGTVDELRLEGDRLTGHVDAVRRGTVVVTVETGRAEPARADALVAVTGPDDPDLEAKAGVNYEIANVRVLARILAPVTDGRFDVVLPPTADRAAIVKVYAAGAGEDGEPADAFGALRLVTPSSSPAASGSRRRRPRSRRRGRRRTRTGRHTAPRRPAAPGSR